ncbi:MAG: DUF3099 domain-containing protein [Streptosporangiales bacterium]|nr:DUF3099 domain-containing protein [Streptosporangiales bacterium]
MSDDIRYRQKRYVIHMGIRTVCIILAVAVPMPLPLRVVVIAAAIGLPYLAVVFANGGREPERSQFDPREPPKKPRSRRSPDAPDEVPTHRHEIGSRGPRRPEDEDFPSAKP